MNWEETIEYVRSKPEYGQLVRDAYLGDDNVENVHRFRNSEEFQETLKILNSLNLGPGIKILDIGAGNGISSLSFALEGYDVTAIEPDPSHSIGAGKIIDTAEKLSLKNIVVKICYAEELDSEFEYGFVYARQSLHHAGHLQKFVEQCSRHLMDGGYLLTTRDHVVDSKSEMDTFLDNHPLHKYYGGEQAFSLKEYLSAFNSAGLETISILGPRKSVINFSPKTQQERNSELGNFLRMKRLGVFKSSTFILNHLAEYLDKKDQSPGRLYSFLNKKTKRR